MSTSRHIFDDATGFLLTLQYAGQLWNGCKARKPVKCLMCQHWCATRSPIFRPLTNGGNRMQRICEECATTTARNN